MGKGNVDHSKLPVGKIKAVHVTDSRSPRHVVTAVTVVKKQGLDVEEQLMLGNLPKGDRLAQTHGECPVCFNSLASAQTCVFTTDEKRTCQHIFHQDCAENLLTSNCPLCEKAFRSITPLPRPEENAGRWFNMVDYDGNGKLTKEEVVNIFSAQLDIDAGKLRETLSNLWARWDMDGDGVITVEEMLKPKKGLLDFVLNARGLDKKSYGDPPKLNDTESFFAFWDEDGSGELEKEEVVRAIVKTYRLDFIDLGRVVAVRSVVDAVWDIFDQDKSGGVSRDEFTRRDGLGDSLAAQLNYLG
mmetsp:Transcript_6205/g.8153  ORF Transcript_6205/g.8153 Transcript_6205/m.8153 type:complete len:300 (+) Transcript_6205:239-1138(+)|eukprot:CAMPEP_0204871266 /NCGR_PEP_ID=MMETSP1348-20121228/34817_1 /ASSEMBLY_ACC=CAM_ASM_000700 /TAXON_ID=215587 /ORGANISM="Aplanochytrium stocchinoi, Strain GSBS06" /LENGTH=299 /DNA_ID=CAMNT_0052025447 /DNA_START=217 /DNA_END=1116 /DNA_ORIENTATION=-